MKTQTLLRALAIALTFAATADAAAQAWPARPVRIIVSFAAGAGPDIIARAFAEQFSRLWGQQVIVDNRPGSGNVVGAQAAARASPDGYTYYFATAAALVTNPYTFKSLPYDPQRDFAPVAMIGKARFFLLAHNDVAAKSLPELIALDKAQPGKLAFASDGPRNFSGMIGAWLNKLAGTKFLQIPYSVQPLMVQDTIAGRTQLMIMATVTGAPLIKRGALRPLAVSTARRMPGYEDVPSVAETFPGFDFVGWFAIVAPAGTGAEVISRVNRDVDRVLKEPQTMQRLIDFGLFTEGAETPEAVGEFIRNELARWGRVVREIGLQPE